MKLLLLINGNSKKIINAHKFDIEEFDIIKIDEKKLANPGYIKSIIKSKKYEFVYFGTTILELQRFHFFMKSYCFLNRVRNGAIIDENGGFNKYSVMKYIFVESPLLLLEAIASAAVVLYYYLKLPVIKWKLVKKD